MPDFKELVKNLYTSKNRELTPEKLDYITKNYSGKEDDFVKNFYTTIGEDLTPDKLSYIKDTYLKKKDDFQRGYQFGSETLPIGSKPSQTQVDTSVPSVLLSDEQKQQQEKDRIGKRFETTLLNIPTEFGRVAPAMKAAQQIQETLPEKPKFRKIGEIPRMQPTAMTEGERLGESLTEETDLQELTTDKFTKKKTGLQKQIENAENAFISAQGEDVARDIKIYQENPDSFREIEPRTWLGNAIKQGLLTGELANTLPTGGRVPTPEDLSLAADINYQIERIPQSEAQKEYQKSGLKVFSNPLLGAQFLTETIASSLASLYEASKRTVPTATATGAGAGAFFGGIGALPGAGLGASAGLSVAGLNLSTSGDIMQSLKDSGVDITNKDALIKAFSNENKMSEIRTKALKYGVPILVFDMATAGIAGKLIGGASGKSIAKKISAGLGEAGIQSVGGASGELAGQVVSGKPIDWNEVAIEGIASLVTDAPDVAIGALTRDKSSSSNKNIATQINKLGSDNGSIDAKINLDRDLANGTITPDEYQQGIEFIGKALAANEKIPAEINSDIREKSIELIAKKDDILSEIESLNEEKSRTDDSFHQSIDEKIKAKESEIEIINQDIQKLTKEDAIQVETAGQVPVLTEATVGEEVEQGKPQAKPEVVTEEGAKAEEVGSSVGVDVKITGDIGIDKSSIPLDKKSQPVNLGSILAKNGDKLDLSAEEINLSYPGKKKYVRKITATNGAEKAIISFWKNGNKLIILHVESSKKGAGYGTDLINKVIKEAKEAGVEEIVADNVESLSSQKYWEKQGFIQDPDSRSNRILPIAPTKEIVKTQEQTPLQQVKQLRAEEQAEYAAMDDPKDEVKRREIYERYDKLITPPLKEAKADAIITPDNSSNYANMTEDDKGNFVFFHVGKKGYKTVKPGTGGSTVTSREEASALSKVGGLAMYYTDPNQKEKQSAEGAKYAVKVPKEKVYDFNTDKLNFIEEAEARHDAENPGKAFDLNSQLAYVTKIAGENGFDMVVAQWNNMTRAQTTKELTPTDIQESDGNVVKSKFTEEYESNKQKGFEPVVPVSKSKKLAALYDKINKIRNKEKIYDDLYRLYTDSGKLDQEEISNLINESDLPQEIKDEYKDILESKDESRRSKKIAGEKVKVENAPDGNHLNIGLNEGRTENKMSINDVLSKLPKDVNVISYSEIDVAGGEPTLVIETDRPLTATQIIKLLGDTKQQAIPQLSNGEGILYDTEGGTENGWGEFDPNLFILQDGKVLSEYKKIDNKVELKDLASKIRGLKINLGKGTAQSNIAGLPIALYNSTVEAVALFIEAGSTIAEAIDKAIKKYNLDKVNGFNKSELSKNIQESSKPKISKSIKDIDVNKIRTQNIPGKRISKGLTVKNVKGEKIVEESDNLSAEYVKENAPDVFINNANILTKYPIVAGIKKFGEIKNIEDAQQVYDIFIRQVADNLKNLTNDYNPEFRDIATLWYDGANMLANKLSSEYNVTPEQAAGIIAAMSPQKDWYVNVRLAELVMLAYKQDAVLTNDMIAKQIEIIKIGEKPFLKNISAAKKSLQKNRTKENVKKSIDAQEKYNKNKENADKVIELLKKYVGVNINSAPKAIQPYIIRLNSELNNSKDFNILRPDGEVVGFAKTIGGENKKIGWGSYSEIGKAASIYNDGSQENITKSLGEMHKIRNFYNNIIDPMSKDGDVTIDTHAVAAALMKPLSGSSKEVNQNFGAGTSNSGTLGIKGLYYVYLDAYNLAAKELGLLPRQVQSITWEAVRGLFTDTFKRDASKVKKINDIWKNYEDGNITIEQTRRDVTESAGGIKDPTWAKSILPESEDGIEQGSIGGGTRVDGPTTVGESSSVRVAAKALRKIKINLGKGTAQSNIAGLPIALYNAVIETIALGLEAGDSLATAIKNAIEKYKLDNVKDFDKDLFISEIEKSLSGPITNLKQAKAKRISFEDINNLIELGVTYIEESVKDLKDITFEEFSTKIQDEYGQDIPENIIRNIFKKSAAAIKLGVRRTPERIGTGEAVSASLKEVANETAALYQKQDYKEIQDRLDSMSEADKNTLVGTLANVTGQLNAEGNVGVLAAIDLINMYEANGDKAGAKRVFDTISKSATAFAQLLRQYGQLKSSTPQGYVSIVEKYMKDKHGVDLTDVQKQAIEKLYNDSKKAIDIEADALNNLVDNLKSDPNYNSNIGYKVYGEATVLAEDANRRLADYIDSLKPATAQSLFQKLTSIVQGNLLSLKSLLLNPVANAAQAGIKLSGNEVANLSDFIINTTLKTGRTKISGFDPLAIRLGGKAFTRGLAKANRMLMRGATSTDLAKIDVTGRLKPVEAWKSLYKSLRGKQAIEFVKTIEDLAEGTIGLSANLSLRLLPYGDLPRNEQVKIAKLIEIGRNKFGLKGNQLEAFTLKPDPESLAEAELEGDKSTLQEPNKAYTFLNNIINSIDSKADDKFVKGILSSIKFIVRGTIVPFLKTPINYAAKTIRFTNPIIPYSQAVYHMVKAIQSAKNIKNPLLRESAIRKHQSKLTEYLGEAIIAQSIMSAALILISNGLVTGDAPDEEKEKNLMFKSVGPNMINISGVKRLLTGGDSTYKPGDTVIAYNALGVLGAQLGISSNTLTTKEKQNIREKKFVTTEGKPFYEEDKGFYLSSIQAMSSNLPASLNFTLNQGFAQGAGTLLTSIGDNEYSKWSNQTVKTLVTGLVVPNTVYQSLKAGNDYYRNVYTEDQLKTWSNIVKERYGNIEGLPINYDMFGKPIKLTPEGSNPYVYHVLDIFRTQKILQDKNTYYVFDLYKKTGDKSVIPSSVKDIIDEEGGVYTKLTSEQKSELQRIVGEERFKYINGDKPSSSSMKNYDPNNDSEVYWEKQVQKIKLANEVGLQSGKRRFKKEILNKTKK